MCNYKRGNLTHIFCSVVLFFCLFTMAAAVSAEETPGLKEQFEKKISELARVPVSVSKYSVKYDTIHLRGIKIGDPARPELPSANIKKLSASCDLMSLLVGKLVLKKVNISSLSGHLTLNSSGDLVLGDIPLPASSTLPANTNDLPFLNVRGSNLKFDISDKRSGQTIALQIPALRVSRTATAGEMLVDLKGTVARIPFQANVRAEALSPLNASGSVVIGPALAESMLTVLKTFLPGRLDAVQSVSGKADVSMDFSTAPGKTGYLEIEARVFSYNVVVPVSGTNKSPYIFPFKNLVTSLRYSGNLLTIKKAHAELFGGILEGTGTVLPMKTPISFNVNAKGTGLQTEAFLEQNTSQKHVVSGPISGTFQAAGNAAGLITWNGKGSLLMQNGKYQAPPVITPLLSLANLKEFSSGDLKEAKGTFILNNGIMTTNDLSFLSNAGKADYRGNIGLDTSLQGNLDLHFAQAAVQRSQVLQQISLDGKTANIPTRVEGTLLDPTFPGFSTGKLLELGLKRKGQKMLQDILLPGSKKPTTSPDASPAPAKAEDALKNELRKLFKF